MIMNDIDILAFSRSDSRPRRRWPPATLRLHLPVSIKHDQNMDEEDQMEVSINYGTQNVWSIMENTIKLEMDDDWG